MKTILDLTGEKFFSLTVKRLSHRRSKSGKVMWWVSCKCNPSVEFEVVGNSLKTGNTKSCGCHHREMAKSCNTVHGETAYKRGSSREYSIWKGMKARCFYSRHQFYHRYGGRGITVCERWMDFRNFLEDMGRCPDGFSLDRIDNDGDYEPSNCRWADNKTQRANR